MSAASKPARPKAKRPARPITPKRRALLAKVHIAKKQLGLSDDVYRTTIETVFPGKTSAKTLHDTELENLIAHFKTKGFKETSRGKRKPGYRTESGRPMVRKIYVLWAILYNHNRVSAKRPDGFVKRQTKSPRKPDGVGNPEWLEDDEAWQVIEALKSWIKREDLTQYLD